MTDHSIKPRKGLLARAFGVIIDPGATFDDIVRRPDAIVPIAFILIIAALGAVSVLLNLRNLPETTPTGVPMPPPSVTLVISVIGALFTQLIWWPVRALVFTGVGSLLGAKVEFARSLAVSGYLNVTAVLSTLISAIAYATTGHVVTLSLGMGLSPEQTATPWGVLLSSVNVFGLTYIVLSTVALARLWGVKASKSAAATVILWLIVVAISAGGVHLGSQFAGMFQMPEQ
ncbi:MAG: Yip1 family protein [Bacillota bacterium]